MTVSVVYSDVSYFMVWYFAKAKNPTPWCAVPKNKGATARYDILCVSSEADVHALIDALATLVVASGEDPRWPTPA